MRDTFQRNIDYLRVSVTDKCNLRCLYCMPEQGISIKPHADILRFEEILRIVQAAAGIGVSRVRVTGGEPLVRRGVVDFIRQLASIPEIKDLSLTTNGVYLGEMAGRLKAAGLNRVNISLDSLDPGKYRTITRLGNIMDVYRGIFAALEAGLSPVKINVVAIRGFNDDEILEFVELTVKFPLHVRFIELMPIGERSAWSYGKFISAEEIREKIKARYGLVPGKGVKGSGPATYWQVPGGQGSLGFINALSNHFCGSCNRLRLTCEGKLRPCLQGDREVDLREPLRSGATTESLTDLIREAVLLKPERHRMCFPGEQGTKRMMYQIGG